MGDQVAKKKQVKVDNWGIFFLQRLQLFFIRGEHCDLTLHFTTGEKTKVHRLVVNACTDYFQVLEKQNQPVNNVLTLPNHLYPDVVVPIINFMYTGQLEFRMDLFKELYNTAQQMNMTVLTKLLDAQTSLPAVPSKPIPKKVAQMPITHNLQGKKIFAKNVDPDLPEPLPGRKLPIWKRRNVPANVSAFYDDSSSSFDYEHKPSSQPSMEEVPKPTRFEWPEETLGSTPYTSTFDDLSYETKPIVKPFGSILNKAPTKSETSCEATFEEVCRTAVNVNMKRLASSPVQDESASKKSKMLDLQAVKEYAQEHRLRKDLLVTTEEHGEEVDDDLAVADMDDDDDMEDDDIDGTFESSEPKQESTSQPSDAEVNCQSGQEQPEAKQAEIPAAVAPLTLSQIGSSLNQKSDLTQALTQVIVQPTQMLEPQIIHITQNPQISGTQQQLVLQAHGLPSHIQLLRAQPQVLPETHLTVHPQLTTEAKLTHGSSNPNELAADSQLAIQPQIVTQTQLTSQPHIITQAQLAAQTQLVNQRQLTSQPQIVTQTQLVSQAQIVSQARLVSSSQLITPEHFSSQRHIITQAQLTSQPQIVQTQMASQPQMVSHPQLTSQSQIIAQTPLTSQPQLISQTQLVSQPHIVPQSQLTSQPLIVAHTQFSQSQAAAQTQLTVPSQVVPQSHLARESELDTEVQLTTPPLVHSQIDSKMQIRNQLQPSAKPQLTLQMAPQPSQMQKQITTKYQIIASAPFSKASDLAPRTQISSEPPPLIRTSFQPQVSAAPQLIMSVSPQVVSQPQTHVASSLPAAVSQLLAPTVTSNHKDSPSQAQKSILKTQTSHEEPVAASNPVSVTTKKVRFSLDAKLSEGKENAASDAPSSNIRCAEERPVPAHVENLNTVSTATVTTGNLSNHAKIISEVLKKYPHLVKNNKNIRLKIMQRGGQVTPMISPVDPSASKMVKSKVSYVVLKSEVAGKGKSAVVLKHGGHVEPLSELGGQKPASGAENVTGPWLCHSCGTNEEPIRFESYYLYRRHLQYVHMEKIDARICEHCGHRASKRNLLLYHLYTKHAVPPPRNCQFPKCDQCDYVALSESLLIKHRRYHSNSREFVCKVCNATFKSNGALQGHMQTNLHSDPLKKLYECPFCQKPFVRNINLKAHIRSNHREVIRKMNEEEKNHVEAQNKHLGDLQNLEDEAHSSEVIGEEEEEGEGVQVPVIGNAVAQKQTEKQVILQPGMRVLAEAPAATQTAVPSSEAEALSNVASGIAASLGLADTLSGEQTVIVLDGNPELILQSTEIVSEEIANTDDKINSEGTITIGSEMQEYIIPEMMPEDAPENSQEHSQTYVDTLTDFEHYPGGEGSTTVSVVPSAETVSNQQLSTAPPPVSVAVSVAGGGKVTMFLTDHDYAPIRHSNGDVMFFIARPVSEESSEQCTISEVQEDQTIPVLEKEASPPQLTAEPSHVIVTKESYSNIPPVLTREVGTDVALSVKHDSGQEESVKQQSTVDTIVTSPRQENEAVPAIAANIEEVTENVQVIQKSASEVTEASDSMPVLGEEPPLNTRETSTQGSLQPQQKSAEQAVLCVAESTKPLQETQRKATIQMADLVKEWDDIDEEESIEVISEKDIREDTQ